MPITTLTKAGAFDNDNINQINANFASLAGTQAGGALASAKVLVGNAEGQAAAVDVSGDASIANTGALTVTGVNGEDVAADGAEIDAVVTVVAAIPTVDPADGETIWNDNGVLKVASST